MLFSTFEAYKSFSHIFALFVLVDAYFTEWHFYTSFEDSKLYPNYLLLPTISIVALLVFVR